MTSVSSERPGRAAIFGRLVGSGLGEAALAALVALVVAGVGLTAFATVHWPAFNSSNVTRALTTVGQVVCAVALIAAIWLARRQRPRWLAKLLAWAGISGFVTVTLGMPLAATKLYLLGVSVDQEFRTEYLTRFTDTAALRDMTYADLPPFYPAGWFWIGGRVAHLLGRPGWEIFKPYAIASLAVAAVLGYVLWSKLIRADWAIAVSAAVTVVALTYAAPEAYSAVLVILLPPVLVLAWGALYRPVEYAGGGESTAGGWGAVLGTGLFLGVSATFYTLYTVVAACAVGLMALLACAAALWRRHGRRADRSRFALLWPILSRLIAIGVIAGCIALVTWAPYLLELVSKPAAKSGSALHYLPESGAELPLPMADFSLLGALCLLGTVWLVVRAASSRRAQALGIGVVAIYLWALLSMAATAAGTTLLSFRLEPVLQVLLAAAGAFGFVEGARAIYRACNEPNRFRVAAVALAIIGGLAFAQNIPTVLTPEITTAYTDTDGAGNRADQRDPSAVSHYREIDAKLLAQTGRPRAETVVLTADTSFLAFYPYYGFQALTSHYANMLADFSGRAAVIDSWSKLDTSAALLDALDRSPWRAPDAFLFRREGQTYTLRLARDVYPNDPNVQRYTVSFPAELFADPHFTATDIGPFTLITVRR
ncbi:hypothetical protein D5S18_13135 [Nocardia panacis]|uniref:Galactan 5-O-arabinofuranosyltransferase n=1 Tax=Nocardia panacis TaxID=2340916 RepID=A0A3A4KP15_9NOCA|nr:galactan 5-O-arabinofuranosyltransferase [Nocardia panacis]RJO77107.1 hypothetical protein D5S18_13135 [Nocardia panacis]